uniref:Bursicon n=1 Tax=Ditylenchus dipsaci TaxID=166011 RepID=A0A915D7A8_9BILA
MLVANPIVSRESSSQQQNTTETSSTTNHPNSREQQNEEVLRYNVRESVTTPSAQQLPPEAWQSRSKNAFLQLQSKNYVEPPLLPDEERRQVWLERHRHKQQEKLERKESRKKVLTLTTADLMSQNQTFCTGDLFKHKVRMAGCEPKLIINRFCHGSCASFYIPKLRSKKLKATFQSCAACVPSETDLVQVRLDCPFRPEKEIYRTVMRVKKCACRNIELDNEEDEEDY